MCKINDYEYVYLFVRCNVQCVHTCILAALVRTVLNSNLVLSEYHCPLCAMNTVYIYLMGSLISLHKHELVELLIIVF